MIIKSFLAKSPSDTEHLASRIATTCRGGEVFELIGDLGAGKTTFTRGFVAGLGSDDKVTSPTFTLCNIYESPSFEVRHYDFYRLDDYETVARDFNEVIENKQAVIIMEWAESVRTLVSSNLITIQIDATAEDFRDIKIALPDECSYLKGAI
jgi:tRNA threonylcarbamoyladenosine biosynthesis protein TsaE